MRTLIKVMLMFVSFNLFAGDKVDKTIDVDAMGRVEISNTRGEISVTSWEQSKVSVQGKLDDLAESFVFERQGETTIIRIKLPRNTNFRSREGSKLKIKIPQTSSLSFSGVATDLNISKVDGAVEINSVSGNITASQIMGRTYINNVSGKLTLSDIQGKLELSTVSGDINAAVASEKIKISGVTARLSITSKMISSAVVSSVSGDVKLVGPMTEEGEISLSSVSGEAIYYVTGELNARVAMDTAPGGRIINEYSAAKPQVSFINSQSLSFSAGSGKSNIRMSTVSGSIGLKRQKNP